MIQTQSNLMRLFFLFIRTDFVGKVKSLQNPTYSFGTIVAELLSKRRDASGGLTAVKIEGKIRDEEI